MAANSPVIHLIFILLYFIISSDQHDRLYRPTDWLILDWLLSFVHRTYLAVFFRKDLLSIGFGIVFECLLEFGKSYELIRYLNRKKILNMKSLTKVLFVACLSLGTFQSKAQHREIGLQSTAIMGAFYGPALDLRPSFKWGKSFDKVYRVRFDRTFLNASMYQDKFYMSFSTGFYFGRETRREIGNKFYLITAPEIGTYYATSTNYQSVTPALRYNFGALYRVNDNFIVSVEAPLSLGFSFYQNQGVWQNNSMNMSLLGESPLITASYTFKKKTKK